MTLISALEKVMPRFEQVEEVGVHKGDWAANQTQKINLQKELRWNPRFFSKPL